MSIIHDDYGYLYQAPTAVAADKLARARVQRGRFTIALPMDSGIRRRQTALISLDSAVFTAAALMVGGRATSTLERGFSFSHFIDLEELTVAELQAQTPLWWGQMKSQDWVRVSEAVKALRPHVAEEIASLERLARQQQLPEPSSSMEVMAMEKDAVGLAMAIAGVSRPAHLPIQSPRGAEPFLLALKGVEIYEDTMVEHDHHVFGDWNRVRQEVVGWVEFQMGSKTLKILNVNRKPLERTTGVDLIYYHHEHRSYTMVQYKRMISEGAKMVYRPGSDPSFRRELERMRRLDSHAPTRRGIYDYRLFSGACYLKLCPALAFDPLSPELTEGWYLPVDYWTELETGGYLTTHKGATVASTENIGRHFSNTLFVDLVSDGWIGSSGEVTDQIADIIDDGLGASRSEMLAYSTSGLSPRR